MPTPMPLARILFKIEPELKEQFEAAVTARNSDVSKMLRHFIRTYVEEHRTEQEIKIQAGRKTAKKKQ